MATNIHTKESAPLTAVRNPDQTITVTAGCQSFRLTASDIHALNNPSPAPTTHHVNMLGTGQSWLADPGTTTLVIGGLTPALVGRLGLDPSDPAVEQALSGTKILRVTLDKQAMPLDSGHNPDYVISVQPTNL